MKERSAIMNQLHPNFITGVCFMCKKECKGSTSLTKHVKKCTKITNIMWTELGLLREKIKNGDDTEETKEKYERLQKKHTLLTNYGDIISVPGQRQQTAITKLEYIAETWKFIKCNTPESKIPRRIHMWFWFFITPTEEYFETFDEIIEDLKKLNWIDNKLV